jgi:hypothetical protein
MQVKRKLFPYPVLNNDSSYSNFLNGSFEFEYDDESNQEEIKISRISYKTNSITINNLIREKKAKVLVVFECPSVVLRETYDVTEQPVTIIHKTRDLSDKVEVSMFVVASEDIDYTPGETDEDYKGLLFQIEKYDILAVNDGFRFYVVHENQEDTIIKSIFSIQLSKNLEKGLFEIEFENSRKIVINLSDEDYNNYKVIAQMPLYKEVFFSTLLIPSLAQAIQTSFSQIKVKSLDDIRLNYKWINSVISQYKRVEGKDLNEEEIEKLLNKPIAVAQRILGKPLTQSLITLRDQTTAVPSEEN